MAKAIFEPGQKERALAGGVSVGFNRATHPLPEGDPDPNRATTGKQAEKNNPLHLSGRRQLFYEDLDLASRARLEEKHRQFQESLPYEVTKPSADPGRTQFAAAQVMHSRGESLDQAAKRIATDDDYWARQPQVRQPEDGADKLPGAGWYFSHNEHYRVTHPTVPNASDTGSVMSPLNSPDNEKAATKGLLRAQDKHITITPEMAAHIRKTVALKKGEDPGGLIEERHVGVPVRTKDLHPKVVKYLTLEDTADRFPDAITSWTSPGDRALVRLGGTNVDSGARVLYKGETLDEVANPQSAPKVNNYGKANKNFYPTKAGKQYFMDRANMAETPREGMIPMNDSQEFTMTPGLVDHTLKMMGHGTDAFDPEDRAVQEVVANAGKSMHMDFAHPAIVQALGDLGVKRGHPRVHAQALASMNHPIVADSWMNAVVAGQPQATVLPTDKEGNRTSRSPLGEGTSVFKEAGVYWPNAGVHNPAKSPMTADGKKVKLRKGKTPNPNVREIDQDESILTAGDTKVYGGGASGLQHAADDYVIRRAARWRNVPSVAEQASSWTVNRRIAGRGSGEAY